MSKQSENANAYRMEMCIVWQLITTASVSFIVFLAVDATEWVD
jgi:hypothetical protein